jgi:hypothetical protein
VQVAGGREERKRDSKKSRKENLIFKIKLYMIMICLIL